MVDLWATEMIENVPRDTRVCKTEHVSSAWTVRVLQYLRLPFRETNKRLTLYFRNRIN